jgi:peptidoglycan/LPS O-acetylase OafA/YrhL
VGAFALAAFFIISGLVIYLPTTRQGHLGWVGSEAPGEALRRRAQAAGEAGAS